MVARVFATAVEIPHPYLHFPAFSLLLHVLFKRPGDLAPKDGQILYFASVAVTEMI